MPAGPAFVSAAFKNVLDALCLGFPLVVPGGTPVVVGTLAVGGIFYTCQRRRDENQALPDVSAVITGPLSQLLEKATSELDRAVVTRKRILEEIDLLERNHQQKKAKLDKTLKTQEEIVSKYEKTRDEVKNQTEKIQAFAKDMKEKHAVTATKGDASADPVLDDAVVKAKKTKVRKCTK